MLLFKVQTSSELSIIQDFITLESLPNQRLFYVLIILFQ